MTAAYYQQQQQQQQLQQQHNNSSNSNSSNIYSSNSNSSNPIPAPCWPAMDPVAPVPAWVSVGAEAVVALGAWSVSAVHWDFHRKANLYSQQ